jgi:hypothetical protein
VAKPVADAPTAREAAPAVPMVHLAIRFALELACWGSIGYWAWKRFDGGSAGALAAAVAFTVVSLVWGLLKTRGEQGPKEPTVPIPGWTRLLVELAIYALASAALWSAWSRAAAETLMTVLALHVAVTWERHWWLLRARREPAPPEVA